MNARSRRDAISQETRQYPDASVRSQQQQRERELRKQHEREQRRRYEEMEQLRREEERRHAEREQVGTHKPEGLMGKRLGAPPHIKGELPLLARLADNPDTHFDAICCQ